MAEKGTALVFELKGEILPEFVRLKDLAELLANIERLFLPIIYRDYPDLRKKEERVLISLTEVSKGSVKVPLRSPFTSVLLAAYSFLALVIENKDYRRLPPSSMKSLKEIADFSRKYNAQSFIMSDDPQRPVVELPSSDQLKDGPIIRGKTTVYGRILRVGGKTKPTLMIETLDGRTFFCDVTQEQARELASRLYKMVSLKGLATWDYHTRKIASFKIEDIKPFGDKKFTVALKEISNQIGHYFDDVDDVVDFVTRLRKGEFL
ncbi:MAG TPA: hypothetical protein ENF32_06035 [Thermosulfidibacter takaii]|uniref:Uncharacterized protein n=1 Tax=Thermosulfidibacter takaii TaxID=412593 RepID=A0A7C0U715_9BACT|nr:hypothetical protein [Thermosulfidibacter takaii]